jgi:hypothetical protein
MVNASCDVANLVLSNQPADSSNQPFSPACLTSSSIAEIFVTAECYLHWSFRHDLQMD